MSYCDICRKDVDFEEAEILCFNGDKFIKNPPDLDSEAQPIACNDCKDALNKFIEQRRTEREMIDINRRR